MRFGMAVLALATAAIVSCFASLDGFSNGTAPIAGDDGGTPPPNDGGSTDAPVEAAPTCSADLTSDPENCGRCGHSCFGGTCAASQCAPVTVLTHSGSHFFGLAIVPPSLWVADSQSDGTMSQVLRANLDGTNLKPIDTETTRPTGLAADNVHVYFATGEDGRIHALDYDGMVANIVPSANGQAYECVTLAADGKSLYFASQNDVRMLPFNGTTTNVMTNGNGVVGVAASSTALFWTNKNDGTIWTSALDGGAPKSLTSGQGPACMALDGTDFLYWADNASGEIAAWTLSKNMKTTVATGETAPQSVVVTSDSIWWDTPETVRRLAK